MRLGEVRVEFEREARELLVQLAEALLAFLVEVEAVAPEVAERAIEEALPPDGEGVLRPMLLRGIALHDAGEAGVEPERGLDLVDLRLAELRLLADGVVGVRDRHERREIAGVAERERRAIEPCAGGLPRERRVVLAVEAADLEEDRLGARDALVAQLLDARPCELVGARAGRAPAEAEHDRIDVERREGHLRRHLRGGKRGRLVMTARRGREQEQSDERPAGDLHRGAA